ncbi:MAG: MBL fold metallo-hydrolase [Dialister sp.]|nr:MBL fold metallo-hydrolase [Dialister sp.]
MGDAKIAYMVLGPFMTNTYILYDEALKKASIIDPSFTPESILKFLSEKELDVESILLTHAHVDHIAGLNQIRKEYPYSKTYMSKQDEAYLTDPSKNLSDSFPTPVICEAPDVWISNKETIHTLGEDLLVLSTPGHTPGGVSYYWKEKHIVFTGDALFQGSIGRTDFPGGNMDELLSSIRENLFVLPDDTIVLSGHGSPTTIGIEKKSNPFF